MKKSLIFAVGVLISLVTGYELIGKNLLLLRLEMSNVRYIYLLPCAVLLALSVVARAVRWHILLGREINFRHSFHINSIGFLANSILPFRLGDLTRAWVTSQLDLGVEGFAVLSSIVVERLLDLFALLTMMCMALLVLNLSQEVMAAGIVVGIVALTCSTGLIMLSYRPGWATSAGRFAAGFPRLERLNLSTRLEHFVSGLHVLRNPGTVFAAFVWTGIAWAFDLSAAYVILFIVFDTPPAVTALAMMILLTLSITLPAVPGNLGPFQAAIVGALWISGMIPSMASPSNVPAILIGVWLHVLTLGIYLILGLVGLSAEGLSMQQITQDLRRFSRNIQASVVDSP